MLDAMIHDLIVAHPNLRQRLEVLCAEDVLTLLSTHIQQDQLSAIPTQQLREDALSVPTTKVPTSAAIWGLSKWDECKWGDSASESMIAKLQKGNPKHAPDALIGLTAASVADAFVTNDKGLAARLRAADATIAVWDFTKFVEFIDGLKN